MMYELYDYRESIDPVIVEAESLLEAAQLVDKDHHKDARFFYLWGDNENKGFVDEILRRDPQTGA